MKKYEKLTENCLLTLFKSRNTLKNPVTLTPLGM